MTTWADLKRYIEANYKVQQSAENLIRMSFSLPDLRSQTVFVWRLSLMDGDEAWVQLESPVGKSGEVDLATALEATKDLVCGGLALAGEFVVVRHAAPIANLDPNEFDRPLELVTRAADALERTLNDGADRY